MISTQVANLKRFAKLLADALPDRTFPGDEIVVPLLGSAVRDSGAMFGMVVASNEEDRRTYGDDLKTMGFTILQGGADYAHVRDTVGSTVGGRCCVCVCSRSSHRL